MKLIPFKIILSSRSIVSTIIMCMGTAITVTFTMPILTPHLESSFGLSASVSSCIFGIPALTYVIFLNTLPRMYKFVDKRVFLSTGLILGVLSIEFMACETYFGFNKNLVIFIVGMLLLGIS